MKAHRLHTIAAASRSGNRTRQTVGRIDSPAGPQRRPTTIRAWRGRPTLPRAFIESRDVSLRRRLADFGFESNDDYDYALRCLNEADLAHLRVLHVDGEGGRRKTAFANALAHALDFDHVLYHDFTRPEPPSAVLASDDPSLPPEPGLSSFERCIVEACAYSEAARTALILDQLQQAPFADQLRIVRFAETGDWFAGSASVTANPKHFLMMLASEEPLYHSLARLSYRVWTDAERSWVAIRPDEVGLPPDAEGMLESLAQLFEALQARPTPTELRRLIHDLVHRVRSEDQLRQSVFGWTEGVDRRRLLDPEVTPILRRVLDELATFLGADHVEA